jgi:endonuclease YncB( thermonuclease family)
VKRPRSSADLAHRRSGRPLGGVLPIIGVIFGLGLLAGAILHPPAGTDPFASAARERGAFSWSRYRFAEFNPQATYRADVLRVIDGDTFEARIRIWSGFEITTRVRLRAIDAPELHARCASEYFKAEAARLALQRLLSAGGVTLSLVGCQ